MAKGRVEKRGTKRRQVKPVILIVTEGSKTEPQYFNHFRTRQTNIDVQVLKSHTGGGRTDYISLVHKAIDYSTKNQLSTSHGDAMWVVADGDVNYGAPAPVEAKDAQLNRARAMAEKASIQIAISNPCFEFWYLLHFRYTTGYLRDYNAVVDALKAFLPDYEKNSDVAERLAANLSVALQNAERLEERHISDGNNEPFSLNINPYTEVFKLMKTLQ